MRGVTAVERRDTRASAVNAWAPLDGNRMKEGKAVSASHADVRFIQPRQRHLGCEDEVDLMQRRGSRQHITTEFRLRPPAAAFDPTGLMRSGAWKRKGCLAARGAWY